MKIPRLTVITLGVTDLRIATKFYEAVLGTPPNTSYDGITFFELPECETGGKTGFKVCLTFRY